MVEHLQVTGENKFTGFFEKQGLNILWINVAEDVIREG